MADQDLIVAEDADEHARLAAELMARAIHEAVQARGVARVALSGGTTPSPAYRALAALDLPWARVEWFWVDERAVPVSSPRSNFTVAAHDLGQVLGAGLVHRMPADMPDLERAAAEYEAVLRDRFGVASAVAFDVMTLGVGDDGHTASLFPGTGAVRIADRLVAAIPAQRDRGLEPRLTLTAPVLREARLCLVLAVGAKKKDVVSRARTSGDEDEVPARVVLSSKGDVVWLVDGAAAP
jgi:6-phosphogluconolactonase